MSHSRFNLSEYLSSIGLQNYHPEPTLACLNEITFHHATTFPYQNTRLYQEGKKPAEQRQAASLDPDTLFNEVVNQKMPAYCFQNNGLLFAALTSIGFTVSKHLSKVILERREKIDISKISPRPVSHVTLKVTIDGCDYLVDTGFSNESLRQALPIAAGIHELTSDTYHLEEMPDHWVLNCLRHDREAERFWFCQYLFDKKMANNADVEKAHQDLYQADIMPIRTDMLLYAAVSPTKRKYVYWSALENHGVFRSINLDGSVRDGKEFTSEADAAAFAKQKFSLTPGG